MKKSIKDFMSMSLNQDKITMLTAYDYPTASLLEKAGVDMLLVGDSLGMVVLGYESTVPVTMEDMLHHAKAVRRGAKDTFVVVDMPFMSYSFPEDALKNAGRLVQEGGADAVKLEGGEDFKDIIKLITKAGIPVVAHIGLTPQTVTQLGGYKVQGKELESAQKLINDAIQLEKAGAIALVLEAIPAKLAEKISEELTIPTIGIGAGEKCGGQVLVIHDMIGMFDRFTPKFVKKYDQIGFRIIDAAKKYCEEVKNSSFPSDEHSFKINDNVIQNLYGKNDL